MTYVIEALFEVSALITGSIITDNVGNVEPSPLDGNTKEYIPGSHN